MNIQFGTPEQMHQYLADCRVLARLAGHGGAEAIVAVKDGIDVLVMLQPCGSGSVVTPCSEDGPSGGSIHRHARESAAGEAHDLFGLM